MLDELTSAQLSEWEAYNVLDPIGSWRNDLMLAKIASLIQNIAASVYAEEGKEPELLTPSYFIPVWDPEEIRKQKEKEEEKQTMEDLRAGLLAFASTHNARERKKRKVRTVHPHNKIN